MKEGTFYFSHDYNPRLTEKIKKLLRKHGMLGYGIYWAVVEDLYNNANALRTDYEGIAFDLRTPEETVKSVINDFDLFVFNGEYFGSLSVQRRINERESKSVKARESAFKRWEDANALPSHSKGNAIKEKKGNKKKESKEDNSDKDPYSNIPDLWKPIMMEWNEYRNKIKKKLPDINKTLKELQKLSNSDLAIAQQIVDKSISNGYQGLFELKNTNQNNGPKPTGTYSDANPKKSAMSKNIDGWAAIATGQDQTIGATGS
jgi:hypothetical protein